MRVCVWACVISFVCSFVRSYVLAVVRSCVRVHINVFTKYYLILVHFRAPCVYNQALLYYQCNFLWHSRTCCPMADVCSLFSFYSDRLLPVVTGERAFRYRAGSAGQGGSDAATYRPRQQQADAARANHRHSPPSTYGNIAPPPPEYVF